MIRPLAAEDLLFRAPGAHHEWLADGRLLIRHRHGTSLLDGCRPEELEAVLAEVDGRRDAESICKALEPRLAPHRSRRILRLLLGELLVRPEDAEEKLAPEEDKEKQHGENRLPRVAGPDGTAPLRSVGILGGGSAGYLAALALERAFPGLAVTLVESPDIPVIGVGEATTPLMPQFLHADLGVERDDFWLSVRPTLKLGIRFFWGPETRHTFPYPFGPLPIAEAMTYDGHLGNAGSRALMMKTGRIPRPPADPELELGTEMAYHLDNRRFVSWLRALATARGIRRIETEIIAATRVDDPARGRGFVDSLITRDGRRLSFDFYLDCSGFRAFLIGRTLESSWNDWGESLFNDRALVGAVPRHRAGPPKPCTEAHAFSSGWCWNTPVREADHRGYVYSSAFLDDGLAEAEMRRRIPKLGELRRIDFRSGRRDCFWRGNVAALGNAYGFVEPLESTALHLLIRQIGWLIEGLEAGDSTARLPTVDVRRRLSLRCERAWDYLAWFLALHFRFNRALDTPYWRACRAETDIDLHHELVMTFRRRGPLSLDPLLSEGFAYPDPLWGPEGIDTILFGQGVPSGPMTPRLDPDAWRRGSRAWGRAVAACPDHGEWLDAVDRSAVLRQALTLPFERRGPAFRTLAQPSVLRNLRA